MNEAIVVIRILAISQILLWASYFICFHPRQREAWIVFGLSLCFVSYLLLPIFFIVDVNTSVIRTAGLLSNFIPALVWLLAHFLAHDSRRVPLWFWCVTLVYLILMFKPSGIGQPTTEATFLKQFVFFYIPQLIKLLLVIHVIGVAVLDRKNDLINARRRLRIPLVLVSAGVVSLVILVELGLSGRSFQWVELIGSALLLLFIFTVSMAIFTLRPSLATLLQPAPVSITVPDQSSSKSVQDPKINRIVAAMENDRFYANHGVTLDDLADHVGIPTYKTRNLINQQLGFRNFNHFLNHYRIAEAAKRLHSQPRLPILTIALDVGFRSLSSFNQAFKETYQKTPTEFRQESQTDSLNSSVLQESEPSI